MNPYGRVAAPRAVGRRSGPASLIRTSSPYGRICRWSRSDGDETGNAHFFAPAMVSLNEAFTWRKRAEIAIRARARSPAVLPVALCNGGGAVDGGGAEPGCPGWRRYTTGAHPECRKCPWPPFGHRSCSPCFHGNIPPGREHGRRGPCGAGRSCRIRLDQAGSGVTTGAGERRGHGHGKETWT